jgi:hypothetical protein
MFRPPWLLSSEGEAGLLRRSEIEAQSGERFESIVVRGRVGWATPYIAKLRAGETVQFRPRGHSMTGRVDSGQLCTVEPVENPEALQVGDVVLCKVHGTEYLHLIKAIHGARFQIGNNRGHINGWVTRNSLFGKLIGVE